MNRRQFIITTLAAGGGLAVARLTGLTPANAAATYTLGAWPEMGGDGKWTIAESIDFDSLSGAKMGAGLHYAPWQPTGGTLGLDLAADYSQGRSLTHVAWPAGGRPSDIVDGVISGKYDSVIGSVARQLEDARAGRSMHWRPFWEMNGRWMPWNAAKTGNDPTKHRSMFQRTVNIARQTGYGGAIVWSPNAYSSTADSWNTYSAYYPGDQYVDIIGVSAYNGYTSDHNPWRDFSLITSKINTFAQGRGKPLCWSEGSSIEDPMSPGRKAEWIRRLHAHVQNTPRWETLIWFHRPASTKEPNKDYRVNTSSYSLDAWREFVAGT